MTDAPCIEVGRAFRREPAGATASASAAKEALAAIRVHRPSAVLVFASVQHDLPQVVRGVREVIGDVPLLGSTTAGEICDGLHHGTVVVTVLASPYLSVRVGVGEHVSRDWRAAVAAAVDGPALAPWFATDPEAGQRLGGEATGAFAVVLSPGATQAAETRGCPIVELLRRRSLGRLPIFGMSASDEMRFERNFVLAGERAIPDGLVVAVFETQLRFGIAVAHGMHPTGTPMLVTAAEEYEVRELDGRPAADVYAERLGVPRPSLDGVFVARTTRTVVGVPGTLGSFVPNAATYVTPAGGLRFAIPIPPGQSISLLACGPETAASAGPEAIAKARARGEISRPALAVVSSCAIRPLLLGPAWTEEVPSMVRALAGAPLVGCVSCGEAGLTDEGVPQHMNAVIGALVLGDQLSSAAEVARENAALRLRSHAELERLVAERTRQLEAATARLVQADRLVAVGTLAAGVGHEINNPLSYATSGVASLSALVAAHVPDPEQAREAQEILQEIAHGLDRIRRTVQDLKLFSRGDHQVRRPVDVQAVLDATLRLAHNDIRHRARLVRAYGAAPRVAASEARIAQVFLNLVVHACHSLPDGAADRNELRVSVGTDARGWADIEVRDTGPGLSDDERRRIFEPFAPGPQTGLGLAACRSIVEGMGGEITAEESPGGGNLFRVRLPPLTAELPAEQAGADRPSSAPARSPETRRARVLVVDDEPLVARAIERILGREHEVAVETTSARALARLEAGERFDLVLCDVMMPQLSGPEFHARLRRFAPEQAARVVFVTGGAFAPGAARYLEEAGCRVLEKPFEADAVRALVRELV
jgi:signal transduction histidine kinase